MNMDNCRIGLHGVLKEIHNNGGRLRHRINKLLWEIKYAWRRAWNGYDDRDVFNLDASFKERMIVLLEQYKKYNNCLWWCPDGYELGTYDISCNAYVLTEEQRDVIIDTMIFHFKMSDEDYVEKILYGSNIYDEDYTINDFKDYKKIRDIMKQNQDRAMDLLKMFLNDLWY